MAQNDQTAAIAENSRSPQLTTNRRADEMTFAPGSDPLARLAGLAPASPGTNIHASTLNRLTGSAPARAWPSLLQLQRQRGKRYVQRVLALAGQGEGNADVPARAEEAIERVSGGMDGRHEDPLGPRDANGVAEGADTVVDRAASSIGDNSVSAIHRQQTTVPQTTPGTTPVPAPSAASATAQTPGAPPPSTATSAPTSPAPASTTVQAFWYVDWARKETGSAVTSKSNARTGKDSASGTLKAMPTGSTGPKSDPSWSIIPWLNAASSGKVLVGTVTHPKGLGGTASTDVSYGAPPSAKADITIDPEFSANADKNTLKATQNALNDKKKAASDVVSRQLKVDLMSMGTVEMIEEDLNRAVSSAIGQGYKAAVKVTQIAGANSRVPELAAPYDPLMADGIRVVNITVPTEVQELKGTKAASIQTYDSIEVVQKAGHDETTVKDERIDVTTMFIAGVVDAYTDMASKATHDSTSLSGEGKITSGGSASAGGSFKDLDINLGTLLAMLTIEDPPLALALKNVVGSMKVSGDGRVTLGGDLTLKGGASKQWSDDEVRNTLKTHIEDAKSKIKTAFSSVIQKKVNDTYSIAATQRQAAAQSSAASTETVRVDYVVSDQPTLKITSEAVGPARQ